MERRFNIYSNIWRYLQIIYDTFNYLKINSYELKISSNIWRYNMYLQIIEDIFKQLNICWNGVPYITHLNLSSPSRCLSLIWCILKSVRFGCTVCVPSNPEINTLSTEPLSIQLCKMRIIIDTRNTGDYT